MKCKILVIGVVLFFAGFLVISTPSVYATVIDFDSIAATGYYIDVTPGGERGPLLSFTDITFNGGVVMSDDGWLNLATSKSNLYGTSDTAILADGSTQLPGFITGTFTTPASGLITLDVINGAGAANFTLYAWDSNDIQIGLNTIYLNYFGSAGSVGALSLNFSGISYFTVASDQGERAIDFAIDTVRFNAVPEPTSMILLGLGLMGLAGIRRKFKA